MIGLKILHLCGNYIVRTSASSHDWIGFPCYSFPFFFIFSFLRLPNPFCHFGHTKRRASFGTDILKQKDSSYWKRQQTPFFWPLDACYILFLFCMCFGHIGKISRILESWQFALHSTTYLVQLSNFKHWLSAKILMF